MSDLSISSSSEVFFDAELQVMEDRFEIERVAQKIQLIWVQVYNVTIGNFIKMIHIVRNAIGSVIRDAFFFPMKCSAIINKQWVRDRLQMEEKYVLDFWDLTKPLDPNLHLHAEIREKFAPPEDQILSVQLKDGKIVEITCRVIETKQRGDSCYNFVDMPGIYATISNNIAGTYPYLAAYLNNHKEAESLPPARFMVISENNLNYKPTTLDEAGFVLLEVLKSLRTKFGEIDQLVAHSLGTVFLTNALRHVDDPKLLPKHICLDRGPSSIWEASKNHFLGMGRLIYLVARWAEWTSDLEQDIIDFCQKWKERPSLLISGVIQDHQFLGSANLCLGEKIKKNNDIEVLVFDPPRQLVHDQAHHSMRSDFFNPLYLISNSDFMKPLENLSEAIIRHSLPVVEKQEIA